MQNFVDDVLMLKKCTKHRSFKDKSLKYSDIVMNSFNFTYAGIVNIFICYNNRPKDRPYQLTCSGFTYDGQNIFFGHNRHWRRQYNSLYAAILAFHDCVRLFTDSLDWFTPEYFESAEFYNYADEELFK